MKTPTFLIAALLVSGAFVRADVIAEFEKHAASLPGWNDEAKAALAAEGDPAERISSALRVLYPKLGPALEAAAQNPAGLLELANSPDPFLAAESSFFLGRELMKRLEFEQALPLMRRINEEWAEISPRAVDSLYYQGIAQNELLMRGEAIESLSEFVEAGEKGSRLVESALDLLSEMEGRNEGSIGDVADHMGFSERRLTKEDPGEKTQEVQEKIIAMLDTLIQQAEEREKQMQMQGSGGGGSSSGPGGGQPGSGEGQNAGGNSSAQKAPKVVRRVRGSTKSAWDDMRQKDRNAEALSALKSKYPPRYQQLIEQYYRDLNESSTGEGDEEKPAPVN